MARVPQPAPRPFCRAWTSPRGLSSSVRTRKSAALHAARRTQVRKYAVQAAAYRAVSGAPTPTRRARARAGICFSRGGAKPARC